MEWLPKSQKRFDQQHVPVRDGYKIQKEIAVGTWLNKDSEGWKETKEEILEARD